VLHLLILVKLGHILDAIEENRMTTVIC